MENLVAIDFKRCSTCLSVITSATCFKCKAIKNIYYFNKSFIGLL